MLSFQHEVTSEALVLQNPSFLHNDPKDKVWTQGCIDSLKSWINRNLYIVAGSTLGTALMQVCSILTHFALTLSSHLNIF